MVIYNVYKCVLLYTLIGITIQDLVNSRTFTEITVTTQNGTIGRVVSYNYPFSHRYKVSQVYTYRVFLYQVYLNYPLRLRRLCVRFRRFDLGYLGRLSFKDGHHHWYGTDGRRIGGDWTNDTLPQNVWNTFFCALVEDMRRGKGYLEVTYAPGIKDSTRNLPERGFEFEYWHQPDNRSVDDVCEQIRPGDTCAPCLGNFTCYDRKCIPRTSPQCKNQPSCADDSDRSFAHARCQNSSSPVQTRDFWACDFSGGRCSPDTALSSWQASSRIVPPARGPPSDHTGYGAQFTEVGMFVHTTFTSVQQRATLSFNPGPLGNSKDYCLSFWYYMDGDDPGTLSIEEQRGYYPLWTRAGTYGTKWLQGQVALKCDYFCNTKVKFIADVGSNIDSKISLDDVSVMPGLCPYTDVSFLSPGWTITKGCSISRTGELKCRNCFGCRATSPLLVGGKCGIFTAKFDSYSEIRVDQLRARQGRELLVRLNGKEETLIVKISLTSLEPFQIQLYYLDRIIVLGDFHVVDNDCENLTFGACYSSEFFCAEGDCIAAWKRCDGKVDCKGNNCRDETNCTECKFGAFFCNNRCVLNTKKCNGVDDCGDNTDEINCPISSSNRLLVMAGGIVAAVCVAIVSVVAFIYKCCKKHTAPPSCSRHHQAHHDHHPSSPMDYTNHSFTPENNPGTEYVNVNGYLTPSPAYGEYNMSTAPPAYGVVGDDPPSYDEVVTGSLGEINSIAWFPRSGHGISQSAIS